MDSLRRNGLPNRNTIIPNRNTTLGSVNNVLQPNKVKQKNNLTHQMYNNYRKVRTSNIQNGKNNSNLYR